MLLKIATFHPHTEFDDDDDSGGDEELKETGTESRSIDDEDAPETGPKCHPYYKKYVGSGR